VFLLRILRFFSKTTLQTSLGNYSRQNYTLDVGNLEREAEYGVFDAIAIRSGRSER
jgi:hypothetical protein